MINISRVLASLLRILLGLAIAYAALLVLAGKAKALWGDEGGSTGSK